MSHISRGPLVCYQKDLEAGLTPDPQQAAVVMRFQTLFESLQWRPSFLTLFNRSAKIKGIYLWGGVGRGKTYLMDVFYDALPTSKRRFHFHQFMQYVHQELARHRHIKNPLAVVARDIAKTARVLCCDEFFVTDIGDAMLLSGLLQGLFAQGVVLVATSNLEPSRLYWNGLQRDAFLPAIDLLMQHTDVIHLDAAQDYRLRLLKQLSVYYTPLNDAAAGALVSCFKRLLPHAQLSAPTNLRIHDREISAIYVGADVVWFRFAALCEGPRAAKDYVTLSERFHTLLISEVPSLGDHNNDVARRFIYLVDACYDSRVKLIMSAQEPILRLYDSAGRLAVEFSRTQSRLLEMQSEDYLAEPHRYLAHSQR
jgi:cell division protein ZapE